MTDAEQTDAPMDPKEAMRQALERKKQAQNLSNNGGVHGDRKQGGSAHGQMGAKREFRRKSGG